VKKPQVVVVGGGFGGLNVAKALAGAKVDVTIVDRENHHAIASSCSSESRSLA